MLIVGKPNGPKLWPAFIAKTRPPLLSMTITRSLLAAAPPVFWSLCARMTPPVTVLVLNQAASENAAVSGIGFVDVTKPFVPSSDTAVSPLTAPGAPAVAPGWRSPVRVALLLLSVAVVPLSPRRHQTSGFSDDIWLANAG